MFMKTFCNQLIPQEEMEKAEDWLRYFADTLTEEACEKYSKSIAVLLLWGYPIPPRPTVYDYEVQEEE